MKAGIEYLKAQNAERKIAVLGDMLELGKFSKELHEKVGKIVQENKIDILITVGKEAENIANSAVKFGMNKKNIFKFDNNLNAIEKRNPEAAASEAGEHIDNQRRSIMRQIRLEREEETMNALYGKRTIK